MKKLLAATIILFALSMTSPVNAQLLSVKSPTGNDSSKLTDTTQDWSFFTDNENHVLYIDFEKINVNLNTMSLKDKTGKVVFKDENLWQLPVNTIYEVDFSKYPKGDYALELKTFTSVLRKTVSVN
jgi:hypothetical protein